MIFVILARGMVMFYYGVAGATVAGLYFAYYSCYKRPTRPSIPFQGNNNFKVVQKTHNVRPLYDWLQFALNGPYETIPDALKSAPTYIMTDSEFNGAELFQQLQNVSNTTSRAQIYQSHILKLNSKNLPLHCTILHNLIHLGYISYKQNPSTLNENLASLIPFFLPLFGITGEILLVDYIRINHLLSELIPNDIFKLPYTENTSSYQPFKKNSVKN